MGAGTGSLQTALIFCYWVLQKKIDIAAFFGIGLWVKLIGVTNDE